MATNVLLTVDTELTHRHQAAGASWQENLARSFDPAGVGVPYQLDVLRDHGLKACFFVDPMPAVRYGIEPIQRMVEPILAAGQEVQLHLHPFWADTGAPPQFELTAFGRDAQRALIRDARNLLVEAGAPDPIAFRAGSYAADAATLEALADLGFRYDSSHNGSQQPWPSALPLDPGLIDPVAFGGLIEVPVTQIARSRGGLRHLQLCAVSSAEIEAAMLHAATQRQPLVTLVSHSFELATRDGLRPNRTFVRRFERLCRFLADRATALSTAHFTDLDNLDAPARSGPLPSQPWREASRIAQQIWADARYERPATALTALSGSSASGLEMLIPLIAG